MTRIITQKVHINDTFSINTFKCVYTGKEIHENKWFAINNYRQTITKK